MGLPQTGLADAATWRTLVWHYEEPVFSAAALCDYDPPANANWGTAEMIATLQAAGATMVTGGYGRVAVGDVSYEHGGDHPEHDTHEVGLDADIRPMRKANDQCSNGSNWRLAAYDRTATRALILAIRAATPGPREEDPLQRPAADPRGPDGLPGRPRRPSPRPPLRGEPPGSALPLLADVHERLGWAAHGRSGLDFVVQSSVALSCKV